MAQRDAMATDATAAGSNRELIEVLERQIKHGGDTTVDLAAIANETDIVPVLAVEFVHYWIAMGRLHQSWREIAGKAQKNLENGRVKKYAMRTCRTLVMGRTGCPYTGKYSEKAAAQDVDEGCGQHRERSYGRYIFCRASRRDRPGC